MKFSRDVAGPVVIDWELPRETDPENGLTIPEIPLAADLRQRHLLGVVPLRPWELELPKPPTQRVLTQEEIQAIPELVKSRPAFAISLANPEAVSFEIKELAASRVAEIVESIEFRRNELLWNASLRIEVSQLPVFEHLLQVSPDSEITSVLMGSPGKQVPVRYSRRDDLLEVFLPGGHLQTGHLTITGRSDLTMDSWRQLPRVQLFDGEVSRSDLRITDQTNWEIQFEDGSGNVASASELNDAPMDTAGTTRLVGEFHDSEATRPAKARVVIPPSAVSADALSLFTEREDRSWLLQSMYQLKPQGIPLRKAVFEIPPGLEFERIRPAHFRHVVSPSQTNQQLTVFIPDRYAEGTTLTLLTRPDGELSDKLDGLSGGGSPVDLPFPRAVSAMTRQHRLLLPTGQGIVPTIESGRVETMDSWPDWGPAIWSQAIAAGTHAMFRLTGNETRLQVLDAPSGATPDQLMLEETVVWTTRPEEVHGTSILWLDVAEDARLIFDLLPGQSIVNLSDLSVAGRPLALMEGKAAVVLPHQKRTVCLRVDWLDRSPDGHVRLLKYQGLVPQRRLAAVVSRRDQAVLGNESRKLSQLSATLQRWQSLLACLDQSRTGEVPIDGPLLRAIRRCQRISGEALASESAQWPEEITGLHKQLVRDWQSRQERFAISSTFEQSPRSSAMDAFSLLLGQQEHFVPVQWYGLTEQDQPLEFRARMQLSTALVPLLAVLLLGFAVTVVARYQRQLLEFRDNCAQHPAWMLAVLGFAWWLLLIPSFLGLLLIIAAGVVHVWGMFSPRPVSSEP